MARKQIDVVALKEMIKSEFLFRDLAAFDPLQRFSWGWVPSLGHSGGLLVGVGLHREGSLSLAAFQQPAYGSADPQKPTLCLGCSRAQSA